MKIEIIKGDNNPVSDFFSSPSNTPETDAYITSQSYSPTEHQWRCFARKLERERDEARAERDILRLNLLGTIQLNIPVTTDWKEETK
jgi:hypothetical protein